MTKRLVLNRQGKLSLACCFHAIPLAGHRDSGKYAGRALMVTRESVTAQTIPYVMDTLLKLTEALPPPIMQDN